MLHTLQLHVDVLRGRNYLQTEDDPFPCSTFIRVAPYNVELKETLANSFTTDPQANSNAPFYNANVVFNILTELDSVFLLFEVIETSRQKAPYTMYFACQRVSLGEKGKRKEDLLLTKTNPLAPPAASAASAASAARSAACAASSPQLSVCYAVQCPGGALSEAIDVHADVPLYVRPSLTVDQSLVPRGAQYVWVNLTADPRWAEAFRAALARDWRQRPPLLATPAAVAEGAMRRKTRSLSSAKQSQRSSRRSTNASGSGAGNMRSVADVVLKKWCCCRSHEVLTRLRLCAEAFNRGERSLDFTREVETSYRLQCRKRVYLLQELALDALCKEGLCPLRDIINRLWILFVAGIKHDTSGDRSLPQATRRSVKEADFTSAGAVILQSSLLKFLLPSLSQEQCNDICTEDAAAFTAIASGAQGGWTDGGEETSASELHLVPSVKPGVHTFASPAEIAFTLALVEYLGAMLDTLTEVELVAVLRRFEPAVLKAHQRVKKGEESTLTTAISLRTKWRCRRRMYSIEEGIKNEHIGIIGDYEEVS